MACPWTVNGVELYHEESVAFTDRLDDDEGSEQRCHVTPAHGEPIFGGKRRLDRDRRRVGGEVLDQARVVDYEPAVLWGGFLLRVSSS